MVSSIKNSIKRLIVILADNLYMLGITIGMFFIVHGQIIFNKISWHDDIRYLNIGLPSGLLVHGRWFGELFFDIQEIFWGESSSNLIIALESAIAIALSVAFIFRIFDIRNRFIKFALCILFVVFPPRYREYGLYG